MSDLFVGFYDTETDALLGGLEDGTIISADTLTGTTTLVVEVDPSGTLDPRFRSLVMTLSDGTTTYSRHDNKAPYSQFGESGTDYQGGIELTPGEYEFTVEVYSRPGGKGELLGSYTYTFVVTGSENTLPIATDDSFTTDEDLLVAGDVLINDTDPDGDALTVSLLSDVSNGTLDLNADGTFSYTPDANFNGLDSFIYSLSDGNGGTDTATVSISVDPVNDAPEAADDTGYSTPFETPLMLSANVLLGNDSDIDGDVLSVTSVGNATGGTVALVGGAITFTPDTGYEGAAGFTYVISDGNGGSASASVSLTVEAEPAQNAAPVIIGLDPVAAQTFIQGRPAIVIDADVDIFDADLDAANSYDKASLTIHRAGGAEADDVFSLQTSGVSYTVDAANGILQAAGVTFATFASGVGMLTIVFTAAATAALADEVARSVQYANTADAPPASVTLDYTFDDGAGAANSSTTQSIAVNVEESGPVVPENVTYQISSSAQDSEEDAGTGSVSLSSSDLELGQDLSKNLDQIVGLRFVGLDIPDGAVITGAFIQFQVDEVSPGAAALQIWGLDADDASALTSSTNDLSSRFGDVTTASVMWSPNEWLTVGEAGEDQRTVNISAIIQEIVDRDGWSEGNAIALLITGTGERNAESYDGDPSGAPELHIEYVLSNGPSPVFSEDGDPAVNAIDETAAAGTAVGIIASATDPDGDPLTYSIDDSRFAIDPYTGVVTRSEIGTLDFETEPSIAVTVTARTTDLSSATQIFALIVNDVNEAPYVVTQIADVFVAQNQSFSLSVAENFADDDTSHGDALSFQATLADGSDLPSWLDFDDTSFVFSGTPTAADVGAIDITVTASDNNGPLSVTDTFTLNVGEIGGPGSIYILGRSEIYDTIQDAVDAAVNGDIVLVGTGTYDAEIFINGKSITLASEYYLTGDPTYIDLTIISGGLYGVLMESEAVDTVIQGFHFIGNHDGVETNAHGVQILDNIFENIGADAVSIEAVGATVLGNHFILAGGDAVDVDNPTGDVLIENNIMEDSDDDGIEVRNMAYDGPMVTVTIRDNMILRSGEDGVQLIDYPELSNRQFVIEGNLIQDSTDVGLGIMDDGATVEDFRAASMPERVYVFNNTFDGNDYAITGGDTLIAANNIISNSGTLGLKNVDGASTVEYTLFFGNAQDQTGSNVDAATTIYDLDPLFADGFDLQAGSPAIDAGTSSLTYDGELVLDIPVSDYSGAAPDLGWMEYDLL